MKIHFIGSPFTRSRFASPEVSMTVAASSVLGRPLWYELMTSDPKAAETFYKTVVGWSSAPFPQSPEPYTVFQRSGEVMWRA